MLLIILGRPPQPHTTLPDRNPGDRIKVSFPRKLFWMEPAQSDTPRFRITEMGRAL